MNTAAGDPFEGAYQTTNLWLRELMDELGWDDRHRAYHALRTVLHTLRNRLTPAEMVDLGAQLPMVIRGLYYEGWTPNGKPVKERSKEEFLDHIAAAFPNAPDVFPEAVAWAVFKILERHVSAGEIDDVQHILPREIRSLWPEIEESRA